MDNNQNQNPKRTKGPNRTAIQCWQDIERDCLKILKKAEIEAKENADYMAAQKAKEYVIEVLEGNKSAVQACIEFFGPDAFVMETGGQNG